MLGENVRLREPDARFFSLSAHKEERLGPSPRRIGFGHAGGERWPFELGTPLSGSLPARASRGVREPGFDRQFVISLISIAYWNEPPALNQQQPPASQHWLAWVVAL